MTEAERESLASIEFAAIWFIVSKGGKLTDKICKNITSSFQCVYGKERTIDDAFWRLALIYSDEILSYKP
jgi:hypothetical protein